MKIWLDTSNIHTVERANRLGILFGVTTNPTIVANSQRGLEELLEDLLRVQKGPVTAQVVADTAEEMIEQGQHLFSLSNRLIVKVPVTQEGLEAIHGLSSRGIPIMATVVFTPQQALMAALAGADYVAPYINRMANAGIDPWAALSSMSHIFRQNEIQTKILGASIKQIEQIMKCAEIGIHGVTISDNVFEKLIEDEPLTLQAVQQFAETTAIHARRN